jgi:hypothetical protein
MRLPVCSTRYWRSQLMTAVNSMNISQRDAEDDQRAVALVDDHLVDDHLGEHRRRQADELDGQAGEQHVAPDALVLEQFGDEPGKPKQPDETLAADVFLLHCPGSPRMRQSRRNSGIRAGHDSQLGGYSIRLRNAPVRNDRFLPKNDESFPAPAAGTV